MTKKSKAPNRAPSPKLRDELIRRQQEIQTSFESVLDACDEIVALVDDNPDVDLLPDVTIKKLRGLKTVMTEVMRHVWDSDTPTWPRARR